jgi:uncharacterized OsmC-like protein
MSQTMTAGQKREPMPLNGVDTPTLFATINAVKAQPELAQFTFRTRTQWVNGTQTRTRVESFSGAGGQHAHKRVFELDADHPAVLVGSDEGPLPVELLLAALGACLTGSIGNIAAARGVKLTEVRSTLEGSMDIQGILGLSDQVRNGYNKIRVNFTIKGDAPPEKLRAIVEQARARSAVFDVVTSGTKVELSIDAG